MPRKQLRYDIPAGTRATACSACDEAIYFVVTPKGAKMPVSIECDDGQEPSPPGTAPSLAFDGNGIPHFDNCPHPERFSGRNRK